MRILWHSNSPWANTGYGNQTRLFAPRIQALGHDIAVSAFYGLQGGVLNLGGLLVLPAGKTPYGNDSASDHAVNWGADVLITLIDAWVYDPAQMQQGGVKWCIPAGTLVKMADGTDRPIERIQEGDRVMSQRSPMYDPAYLTPSSVKNTWKIPSIESGEIIEIITEDGRKLEVTAENAVAVHTKDGLFAWVDAGCLTSDMMVYCYNSIPSNKGSKGNAENTQNQQHRDRPHQRLSGEPDADRSGVCSRDYRRGRDNLNPSRYEARNTLYAIAEGVCIEYERTSFELAEGSPGDEDKFQDQALEQVQKRSATGMDTVDKRVSVLQRPKDDRTLSDRQAGVGASGDGVYREQRAERAGELQQPVHGERDCDLAKSAIVEPQRIVSLRRRGKPYDYVYDITTDDGNFFAGGILIHNCPWFPVDMEPIPPPVLKPVTRAYRRIVFSKFGERMVQDAGLDCYYVPHGCDTKMFKPIDRATARERMSLPLDKFIVGMVAANKGYPARKAFFENITAFAEFHKKHPDSLLYLHSSPGTAAGEVNLIEFIEHVGLKGGEDVKLPNPYQLGNGFPEVAMVDLYNSFDVFQLVSMGEGFGIPILEAQSCACPVLLGDWTAMSELCFSGWKVDKRDTVPFWTPLGSYQFIPRVGAIVEQLEMAYRMSGNQDYRDRARDGALKYDADKVTEKYWRPVLAEIEQDVDAWKGAGLPVAAEVAAAVRT